MELLKILKVKITYNIDVIDAYNMVFGLNTKLVFYFNDGKRMILKRLSKGNRLTNEIIVSEIHEEERLDLISKYINSRKFNEFEAETQPESIHNLIHNKSTKDFEFRE